MLKEKDVLSDTFLGIWGERGFVSSYQLVDDSLLNLFSKENTWGNHEIMGLIYSQKSLNDLELVNDGDSSYLDRTILHY